MRGLPKITNNPATEARGNFHVAVNAFARNQIENGEGGYMLSREQAGEAFDKLTRSAMALANKQSANHNRAYNALKDSAGREGVVMSQMEEIGTSLLHRALNYATSAQKAGLTEGAAIEHAMNAVAGNPIFDHFGNLNVLAGQLYEEMTLYESMLEYGDAFALPTESGWTHTDISRFRVPVEQVSGSAKLLMGDINPSSHIKTDANRTQISLKNEFKTAATVYEAFTITQAMRDQAVGYQRAVDPALGGFILQNRYFQAQQKQVMKSVEMAMADGFKPGASYIPGVGGEYGYLTSSVQLALTTGTGTWDSSTPRVATVADWLAAPTKLIQKIQNFYYEPVSITAPLDTATDADLANMYKDIVRLVALYARQNINLGQKALVLYVPVEWYAFAVKYPSGGTFNKQLNEMVLTATGGIVKEIEIRPSSLMSYRAQNIHGETGSAFNYFMLVAHGCENEKKPLIMPGQTATPMVVNRYTSAMEMEFYAQLVYGGPMITHYGGVFLLEWSKQA